MSSFFFGASGSLFSLLFSGEGGVVSPGDDGGGGVDDGIGSGVGSESRRALGRGSEASWAFRLALGVLAAAGVAAGGGRAAEGAEKLQIPNSARCAIRHWSNWMLRP